MDEKRYIKRKEKARSEGNREQLAISCNNLGDYYNQEGRYQEALEEYTEEAGVYAKLGKKLDMAKAHRMIGEMFMLLCHFDKAQKHIQIYLKTVKGLQNKVEEQRAYATLGRAHLLHGQSTSETSASVTLEQLKLAEKAFLKSLLLIKEITGQITKLEQLDMQARCYLNIGVVKEHMEQFEESIAYIERAIKICKSHDLFELTHLCYISMSLLYHCKMNDTTLALRYCNLALDIAKRLPNKVQKLCETLITKAEILVKAGDFASAKQILTKAYKKNSPNGNDRATIEKMLRIVVKICQTLDELVTVNSADYRKCKDLYEKLGDCCCHLQNYSKALEYYQKMLECAELNNETGKSLTPIYVSLYQTYKDNQEYDKALEYLWKEYEVNKDVPAEAFSTLCSVAEICELQNQSFWTIQDVYQKARAHVEKIEDDANMRKKLEKILYGRLRKLQIKHKMNTLADLLVQEAASRGLNLEEISNEDSDTESDANENNTPDLGADVCLDDLTDSDTSDLDETDKQRPHRATRGTRCLTIKRNNKGETQLHQACIAGNFELVKRLLDQGHTVNVRDHAGWLPLHEACNHGFRVIVELLLERGALSAINDKGGTSCDGITPLYDACVNGYLDVVELLLERGADATVKTDFGETCLNGLDKWRRTTTITTGEQAHYHQVRTMLLRTLAKVGITGSNTSRESSQKVFPEKERRKTSSFTEDFSEDETNYGNEEPKMRRVKSSSSCQSGRILKDTNKLSRRSGGAGKEYRNVMEQLKHPNRKMKDDDSDSSIPSCSSRQKRNALLESEEVDDENWLVDDIGPEKKKRRFTTPTKERPMSCNSLSSSSYERNSTSKKNLYDSTYNSGFEASLEAAEEATNTSNLLNENQPQTYTKSSSSCNKSRNSSLSLVKRKSKHQASLLDSGFCRFRSESPDIVDDDSNSRVSITSAAEADSTTPIGMAAAAAATSGAASIHLVISPAKASSPLQLRATPVLSATISFKIKVEDELLLVPVERKKLNDINMRWLSEEATRRYYNLTGLKPALRLKTSDGFAYEENDPVSVALEQNMILATVLEWKTAALGQRYEEVCHQLKREINKDIHRVLDRAQSANVLQLEGMWLTPLQTEPIFKALFHQSLLSVIDLSQNFIQNEGCRQLAKAAPTLKQLKVLNLNGNFISAIGLENLLLQPNAFEELEELMISQNPLGNECIRILDKFCNTNSGSMHRSLQKLWISQCGITDLYDYDLCYFQLTAFDISFNRLQYETRSKLLRKLNSCRLRDLNLSYSSVESDSDLDCDAISAAEQIVQFFESGTCEKFRKIELCGCNLGDSQIYRIAQCLNKAAGLESLELSDNTRLNPNSLQYILDEIPHLKKLIATNCNRLVDTQRVKRLGDSQQIPNFMSLTIGNNEEPGCETAVDREIKQELCCMWREHWREKAKSITCENNFILYINDKDLV